MMTEGGILLIILGVLMYIFVDSKIGLASSIAIIGASFYAVYNTMIVSKMISGLHLKAVVEEIVFHLSYIFLGDIPPFLCSNFIFGYPQWFMICAIPIILLYNGEKGKENKAFFYLFYPLHITLFYFLGTLS
jgi:hypothetical protein